MKHCTYQVIAHNITNQKINFAEILVAFKDPKSYFTAVIYGALCLGIASITSFLPTFILQFGYNKRKQEMILPL